MPMPPDTHAAGAVRAALPLDRLPWVRPFARAYAAGAPDLAAFFPGHPADPAAWRDAIARAARAPRDRAALATLVGRQLDRRDAPAEARRAAARLADAAAVAIVTGQQAALFGGPLYTLLKAVTAVQLARRVEAEHGVPAVPVFWVDAEDHDWDEVRTAHVLTADFEPAAVSLPDLPGAGVRPVASIALDARAGAAIEALGASLAPTGFTAGVLDRLRARYVPGAGLARAFAGWLDDLAGHLGLVVFEADDPAGKPLARDLFALELTPPPPAAPLAREAGAALARLGHPAQVEPAADAVALFHLDGDGRHPVRFRDGVFLVADAPRPAGALRDEALAHPDRFSPNVLLRPVVQDRLFPTAAYVAGPNELAYQAQLGGVYRAFGVEPPLIYPRAAATLLDSAAMRFLDRSGVAFEALQARDEAALNHLLEAQWPPEVERAFDEARREIAARLDALRAAVPLVDPTLAGAAGTTSAKMRDTLDTFHGKVVQASKRRHDTLRRQFTRTQALAFPAGQPQERVLSVAFFANRHGLGLADRLVDALPLDTGRHYLLVLP